MVVDCRSLIEFCKAFEQYRSMANSLSMSDPKHGGRSGNKKHLNTTCSSPSSPLCEKSSAAVVDIVIFLLVLVACGFLFTPYFKYMCSEIAEVLPYILLFIGEVIYQVPVAYIAGATVTFILAICFWELYQYRSRKCNNPKCRGLRKAVEFDIQLESEKCVKAMTSSPLASSSSSLALNGSLELGDDHKELEAELKRMAPPNGRAVLVFRSPCGCPTARMEVWGNKKPRRSKK